MTTPFTGATAALLATAFESEQDYLSKQLLKKDNAGSLEWYCKAINPQFKCVSLAHLQTQERLQRVLSQAISNIVSGFANDSRLWKVFGFNEALNHLLQRLSKVPFRPGLFRPDFLHTQENNIVVCEINARFPFNAFLMTHYCKELMIQHLHNKERNMQQSLGKSLSTLSNNWQHESQQKVPNVRRALLERFNPSLPVYIFKGQEKGADIHFLYNELVNLGYAVQFVEPDYKVQTPASICLELHQHEIAQKETLEHLSMLNEIMPVMNDLRSIFISHDKKLLSIFHRDDIIADYCDYSDRKFLKQHVIETYLPSENPEKLHEALANQSDWILKPSLLGKGEGIIIGRNIDQITWRTILQQDIGSSYVLQRYIDQKKFTVPTVDQNGELSPREMNMVGTILCMDNVFLGPGIYRASESDIINVSRGGTFLAPLF